MAEHTIEFSSLGAIIASISAGLGIGLLPEVAVQTFIASNALALHEAPEQYRTVEIKFIYTFIL